MPGGMVGKKPEARSLGYRRPGSGADKGKRTKPRPSTRSVQAGGSWYHVAPRASLGGFRGLAVRALPEDRVGRPDEEEARDPYFRGLNRRKEAQKPQSEGPRHSWLGLASGRNCERPSCPAFRLFCAFSQRPSHLPKSMLPCRANRKPSLKPCRLPQGRNCLRKSAKGVPESRPRRGSAEEQPDLDSEVSLRTGVGDGLLLLDGLAVASSKPVRVRRVRPGRPEGRRR